MKLQVGTKFNILDNDKKYYRLVIFEDGLYKVADKKGFTFVNKSTLAELNDYYKPFKVEIISDSEQSVEKIGISTDEIGRAVAYELMKQGKSVSQSMLEVIENAVFDLLVEKGIVAEALNE